MKNSNSRGFYNLNQRPETSLSRAIIEFLLVLAGFAAFFFLFGCGQKVAKPGSRLQSMQPYTLPGGHKVTAHKDAVFIIDSAGNRLFNVYVNGGKVFITDSTTFKK